MVGLVVRKAGMEESQNLKKMIDISIWVAGKNPHAINRNRNSERAVMGKRKVFGLCYIDHIGFECCTSYIYFLNKQYSIESKIHLLKCTVL